AGTAILLTPRGAQDGGLFAGVSNVTFTHNILYNAAQGFTILGEDDMSPGSQPTTNITIQNNLIDVASGAAERGNIGGPARVFSMQAGWNFQQAINVTIDHNTILHAGDLLYADPLPVPGFVFTNNIVTQGSYGIISGGILGINALNAY